MNKISAIIALVCLITTAFVFSANRVDDLDLWWHLKTGQQIIQNKALPRSDNFSYTTTTPDSLKNIGIKNNQLANPPSSFPYWQANLTNSWLSQVLFYLTYAFAGLKGIGLLKSSIFSITLLVLYLTMTRSGAAPFVSVAILCLVSYIGRDFNYSRPQIFSFMMFAFLLLILSNYRKGGKQFYLLPPFLAIWANLHGAYVLGVLVLFLFSCGELFQFLLRDKWKIRFFQAESQPARRTFIIVAIVAALASLLNPNTFIPFLQVLAIKKSIFSNIEEYAKPMLYEYHAYWFLLFLTALCILLRLRSLHLGDLLIVLVLGVASQLGIRAIMFFTLGSSVLAAISLTEIGKWMTNHRPLHGIREWQPLRSISSWGIHNFALATVFLFLLLKTTADGNVFQFDIKEHTYPEKAVGFIQHQQLGTRIFNPYNWGGYLIWNLLDRKVFIDGRCLNETAYMHYYQILSANKGAVPAQNKPLWRYLLDEYRVDFILMNAVDTSGTIIPLTYEMISAPDWQLVYQDGTALILLRDTPENRATYGHLYLNKQKAILDEMMSESLEGIQRYPATWGYYDILGSIYLQRRELKMARQMFEKYLTMNPNNRYVIQNLNVIRNLSGEPPLPVPEKPSSPHNF